VLRTGGTLYRAGPEHPISGCGGGGG